jgi:hypothetical protein
MPNTWWPSNPAVSCRNKPRYKPVIKAPEPLERLAEKIRNAGEFGQGPRGDARHRPTRPEGGWFARFGSFASILAFPPHVRLRGNLGNDVCPVLPIEGIGVDVIQAPNGGLEPARPERSKEV